MACENADEIGYIARIEGAHEILAQKNGGRIGAKWQKSEDIEKNENACLT